MHDRIIWCSPCPWFSQDRRSFVWFVQGERRGNVLFWHHRSESKIVLNWPSSVISWNSKNKCQKISSFASSHSVSERHRLLCSLAGSLILQVMGVCFPKHSTPKWSQSCWAKEHHRAWPGMSTHVPLVAAGVPLKLEGN